MNNLIYFPANRSLISALCLLLFLAAAVQLNGSEPPATPATAPTAKEKTSETPAEPAIFEMETAQAVMVTVELDFDGKPPSIAEALKQIERISQPAAGRGRVFAILDAFGGPTPDGKLHLSMHISSERPGNGSLVFKRTGKVLWRGHISPATKPPSSSFAGKGLFIMINDERGKSWILDGSGNPRSVLDTIVRDLKIPLRDFWPDGEPRQFTFIYSSCGCPVKVDVLRQGDTTARIKDTPVIFPDDPAVAATIQKLMGWK